MGEGVEWGDCDAGHLVNWAQLEEEDKEEFV